MRDRVNVSIDHRLKTMFEDLREAHGKEWNEMFEEAVIEFLMKVDPVQTLEYVIKQADEKQEERRQALIRSRQNVTALTEKPVKVDSALQKLRDEMFLKDEKTLRLQWPYTINWTRVLEKYQFTKKSEAVGYIKNKLFPE